MCEDNIILQEHWLNQNCIYFLNHLSLRKEVNDFKNNQQRKQH